MARALLVEDLEYAFGIKISEGNNLANIQWVIDYVTAAIKKNNLSKND
jgi:acyl carrier protein